MTIRDLLGIELPIIQAPMAGVQGAATTSSVHREALKSDASRVTALTNVFSGRPARGIVNRLMRELGYMSEAAPPFPLASTALAPLRAAAEKHGSGDFSPLWCGQNATGCKEIPAALLTRELASAGRADDEAGNWIDRSNS